MKLLLVLVFCSFCFCSPPPNREAVRLAHGSRIPIVALYGSGEEVTSVLESYTYNYFNQLWYFHMRVSWQSVPAGERFWVEGLLTLHKDGQYCSWQLERRSRNLAEPSLTENRTGIPEPRLIRCTKHDR